MGTGIRLKGVINATARDNTIFANGDLQVGISVEERSNINGTTIPKDINVLNNTIYYDGINIHYVIRVMATNCENIRVNGNSITGNGLPNKNAIEIRYACSNIEINDNTIQLPNQMTNVISMPHLDQTKMNISICNNKIEGNNTSIIARSIYDSYITNNISDVKTSTNSNISITDSDYTFISNNILLGTSARVYVLNNTRGVNKDNILKITT